VRAVSEHEHRFPAAKFKVAVMCRVSDCTEWRIGTKRGGLRELTPDELITLAARMMEEIAITEAMQIIHGKERGLQRAREVLGHAS
jgi:hypothetical protein